MQDPKRLRRWWGIRSPVTIEWAPVPVDRAGRAQRCTHGPQGGIPPADGSERPSNGSDPRTVGKHHPGWLTGMRLAHVLDERQHDPQHLVAHG